VGRGHIDFWVWNDNPMSLTGASDDGNLTYDFPGPPKGGHWRLVQGPGRPRDYDPAKDKEIVAPHPSKGVATGRRWDRGGNNAFSGGMHKTETVDYAILDRRRAHAGARRRRGGMAARDIVIDVGAWHQWSAATKTAAASRSTRSRRASWTGRRASRRAMTRSCAPTPTAICRRA
jgi:hypothetical protein